jgi:hypothetical protein
MSSRFKIWKTQLTGLPEGEEEFQKWLFVRIAGVLFGGKGGELIILNAGTCTLSIEQQMACIEALLPLWQCSHLLLCRNTSCARVIFYDPLRVKRVISEVQQSVLEQMGYPYPLGPEEFLEEVGRRWRRQGRIPHEIGLALGYPVKDVLGFIGLKQSQCTGLCGWKIYGNPQPSLAKSRRYRKAREQAAAFLRLGPAIL